MPEQENSAVSSPETPAPAPTPVETESQEPQSSFDIADDVWDGEGEDEELSGALLNVPEGGAEAPSSVPAGAKPAGLETPPKPPGPVSTPSQVQSAPPPVQPAPPAAVTQPQGQTPSGPEAVRQTWSQLMDSGREALVNHMADNVFRLTQQEAELAEAGDLSWVPRMGARVYYEAVRSMTELVERAMPQMILQVSRLQQGQREAEEEMFRDFADLRPHRDKVFALGKTIRQLNPQMPRAEFIQLLGMQARHLLGLPLQPPPAAPAAPPQPPQPTQAAPRPNGGFRPIVSSAPSAVRAAPADPNDWGAAMDFMDQL